MCVCVCVYIYIIRVCIYTGLFTHASMRERARERVKKKETLYGNKWIVGRHEYEDLRLRPQF